MDNNALSKNSKAQAYYKKKKEDYEEDFCSLKDIIDKVGREITNRRWIQKRSRRKDIKRNVKRLTSIWRDAQSHL